MNWNQIGWSGQLNKPALVAFLSVVGLALVATAGSLTPSASPISTFHTLGEIWNSIASTSYNSSAVAGNANGSLIQQLKYVENNLGWASSSGSIYLTNTGAFVGIGDSTPETTFEVVGTASVSGTTTFRGLTYTWPSAYTSGFLGSNVSGDLSWTPGRLVTSNSIDFDEIPNALVLDANTTITNGAFSLTIQNASISNRFEVSGTASLSNALFATNGGNVGVGTVTPTTKLQVTGNASVSGNFEVSILPTIGLTANALCLGTGGIMAQNSTTTCLVSSLRFKHDVHDLDAGLSQVLDLRPVAFVPNGRTAEHIGFIAEEVAEIEPRLVFYDDDGVTPRGVEYQEMTALITKAVQEQQAEIQDLRRKADSFSDLFPDLTERLKRLEDRISVLQESIDMIRSQATEPPPDPPGEL